MGIAVWTIMMILVGTFLVADIVIIGEMISERKRRDETTAGENTRH